MANLVNHSRFVNPPDHPSVAYIKQDEIGSVLARALSDLYLNKPKNQLHFLGNWLLNHSAAVKQKQIDVQREELRESLKEKHNKCLQELRNLEEKQQKDLETVKAQEEEFKNRIQQTTDVDDCIDELVEYLKNQTETAACYIGKLEKVKKPISLLDNEKAHIDEDAPMVIRYISASKHSEFMLGKVLTEEQGEATYSIWKEEEEPVMDNEEENGEPVEKREKVKCISVDDVVTDPRIHFFDVPKLGAYFAVPLTYKSCLSEASFDAGVDDALECRKLRAQQEEEKQKSEHASIKEEEEEKVFEEIIEAPYKTVDVKLMVAIDTLGLDRLIKEQEKMVVIDWVNFIRNEWERAENDSLKHDIMTHIAQHFKDHQRHQDKQSEWMEEEKNVIEEIGKGLEVPMSEEVRNFEEQLALLELFRHRLLEDMHDLFEFTHYKVVKYSRVFQVALYLHKVDRDEVVEPKTNMINWKKAKKFLNSDFKTFVTEVHPKGPKTYKPQVYAKTLKLEKDLLAISFDDVQSYSLALAALYRFLEQYFKVRVLDVSNRRHEYNNKVEERENAIRAAEDLADRRKKHLEEVKENYDREIEALEEDAEKPIFDEAKVLQDFDETDSNKPINIPEEVKPDEDNDIDWEETI